MEYFNIIAKILNEHEDIDAGIYDDGDNEGKQVLIISTTKDANYLNELLKAELYDIVDEIERRDYDSFYLDYATENNWFVDGSRAVHARGPQQLPESVIRCLQPVGTVY